jgi:hypothetical protein
MAKIKEGFWRAVAIAVVGGLILAGILAVIGWALNPEQRQWIVHHLSTIGHALAYPFFAVGNWVSHTSPVSRGQCMVWSRTRTRSRLFSYPPCIGERPNDRGPLRTDPG